MTQTEDVETLAVWLQAEFGSWDSWGSVPEGEQAAWLRTAQTMRQQVPQLFRVPLVPNGPDVHTERITITNPADREADYTGETPDGGTQLSGFAGDVAAELLDMVEGSNVELAEITVRWKGTY